MRLLRVFPRRTNATPRDGLAWIGYPNLLAEETRIDQVHVSVTFTWDLPEAERIARAWEAVAPVQIGGPALGQAGDDFTPGRYLRDGYVITSRGCPNRCWFWFQSPDEDSLVFYTLAVALGLGRCAIGIGFSPLTRIRWFSTCGSVIYTNLRWPGIVVSVP